MEHAEPQQNIYAPPVAHLETDQSLDYPFFSTSIKKLTILFVATFSLYAVYWFYKQWKHQSPTMAKKIIPALRALFSIFFTHSLFNRVKKDAEAKGIESDINYTMLATTMVALQILSNVLDIVPLDIGIIPLTLTGIVVIMAMLYPLISVQQKINLINDDPDGASNSSLSAYNYLFIVLGILFWALVVVGMFLPE